MTVTVRKAVKGGLKAKLLSTASPNLIAVNMGTSNLSEENFPIFKNMIRCAQLVIPSSNLIATVDAAGWPTGMSTFQYVLWQGSNVPEWSQGVTSSTPFTCGFKGTGTETVVGNNCTVSAVTYNSGTGYSTFTLYNINSVTNSFGFTVNGASTSASTTDFFAYLPAYPGTAVDTVAAGGVGVPGAFNPEAVAHYSTFAALKAEVWNNVWEDALMGVGSTGSHPTINTTSNFQSLVNGSQVTISLTAPFSIGDTTATLNYPFTGKTGTYGLVPDGSVNEVQICTLVNGSKSVEFVSPTGATYTSTGLTPANLTGSLAQGATSATVQFLCPVQNGTWNVTFSDGETRSCEFSTTAGVTSFSWTGGITNSNGVGTGITIGVTRVQYNVETYPFQWLLQFAIACNTGIYWNLPIMEDGANFSAGSYCKDIVEQYAAAKVANPTWVGILYLSIGNELWNIGVTIAPSIINKQLIVLGGFGPSGSRTAQANYMAYRYYQMANLINSSSAANYFTNGNALNGNIQVVAEEQQGGSGLGYQGDMLTSLTETYTNVTFTSSLSAGATSATFSAEVSGFTSGSFFIKFSDGENLPVTVATTGGVSTATWTTPLASNVTANAQIAIYAYPMAVAISSVPNYVQWLSQAPYLNATFPVNNTITLTAKPSAGDTSAHLTGNWSPTGFFGDPGPWTVQFHALNYPGGTAGAGSGSIADANDAISGGGKRGSSDAGIGSGAISSSDAVAGVGNGDTDTRQVTFSGALASDRTLISWTGGLIVEASTVPSITLPTEAQVNQCLLNQSAINSFECRLESYFILAAHYGLQLQLYESGADLNGLSQVGSFDPNINVGLALVDTTVSPNMKDAIVAYKQGCFNAGVALDNHFHGGISGSALKSSKGDWANPGDCFAETFNTTFGSGVSPIGAANSPVYEAVTQFMSSFTPSRNVITATGQTISGANYADNYNGVLGAPTIGPGFPPYGATCVPYLFWAPAGNWSIVLQTNSTSGTSGLSTMFEYGNPIDGFTTVVSAASPKSIASGNGVNTTLGTMSHPGGPGYLLVGNTGQLALSYVSFKFNYLGSEAFGAGTITDANDTIVGNGTKSGTGSSSGSGAITDANDTVSGSGANGSSGEGSGSIIDPSDSVAGSGNTGTTSMTTSALNPINIGSTPGDGTGDEPRAGFTKIKSDHGNFLSAIGYRPTNPGVFGVTSGSSSTSGGNTTITDGSGVSFATNQFVGQTLTILTGTDAGDSGTISSNTATTITFSGTLTVAAGSGYQINPTVTNSGSDGFATTLGGTTPSTLIDTNQSWSVNTWAGKFVTLMAGAFAGQSSPILSNTATTLVLAAPLASAIAAGTPYTIGASPAEYPNDVAMTPSLAWATSVPITSSSYASGVATINFATQAVAPTTTGGLVRLSGMSSAIWNGTFAITAASTSSISFSVPTFLSNSQNTTTGVFNVGALNQQQNQASIPGAPVVITANAPTGFTVGTTYYVAATPAPTTSSFALSATNGGTAIIPSASSSTCTLTLMVGTPTGNAAYSTTTASTANAAAIQAAWAGGYPVVKINALGGGTVFHDPIQIPDESTLVVNKGCIMVCGQASRSTPPITTASYVDPQTAGFSITSITYARVSSVDLCSVTTASAHGLSTGAYVSINFAAQEGFNGVFKIVVTGANTFTYTPIIRPTAATATLAYVTIPYVAISAASGTGTTATLTFASLGTGVVPAVGSTIVVSGMSVSGYNTAGATVTAATSTTVSYANTTTGTATGFAALQTTLYDYAGGAQSAITSIRYRVAQRYAAIINDGEIDYGVGSSTLQLALYGPTLSGCEEVLIAGEGSYRQLIGKFACLIAGVNKVRVERFKCTGNSQGINFHGPIFNGYIRNYSGQVSDDHIAIAVSQDPKDMLTCGPVLEFEISNPQYLSSINGDGVSIYGSNAYNANCRVLNQDGMIQACYVHVQSTATTANLQGPSVGTLEVVGGYIIDQATESSTFSLDTGSTCQNFVLRNVVSGPNPTYSVTNPLVLFNGYVNNATFQNVVDQITSSVSPFLSMNPSAQTSALVNPQPSSINFQNCSNSISSGILASLTETTGVTGFRTVITINSGDLQTANQVVNCNCASEVDITHTGPYVRSPNGYVKNAGAGNIFMTTVGGYINPSTTLCSISGAGNIYHTNLGTQISRSTVILSSTGVYYVNGSVATIRAQEPSGGSSVTSSTAVANDANLLIPNTVPSGTYDLDCMLYFYGTTTGTQGFKFDFGNLPGTTVSNFIGAIVDSYGTAQGNAAAVTSATTAQNLGTISTSATAPSWIRFKGSVSFTGNSNQIGVRWAQETSSANATNVLQGSYLELRPISVP